MVVKIGVYDLADILIWVQVGNLAKVLCVDDMDWYGGLRRGEGDVNSETAEERIDMRECVKEHIGYESDFTLNLYPQRL